MRLRTARRRNDSFAKQPVTNETFSFFQVQIAEMLKLKAHVEIVQNYCFLLLTLHICHVLVAVAVVVALPPIKLPTSFVQTEEQVPLSDKFRYDATHKDNGKINNMSV